MKTSYPATLSTILVAMATVRAVLDTEVQVVYQAAVNFTCDPAAVHGNSTPLGQRVRRVWILPTGELLDSNNKTGHPRVEVLQDGYLLQVRKVDDADFGLYHCLLYLLDDGRYLLTRHGLNLKGPYYGDLFALRYRTMLITGAVAAAVCLVTIGACCFFYDRHQARLDEQAEQERATRAIMEALEGQLPQEPVTPEQKGVTQYRNTAYVTDGGETVAGCNGAAPMSGVDEETADDQYPYVYTHHGRSGSGAKTISAAAELTNEDPRKATDDDEFDGDVIARTRL